MQRFYLSKESGYSELTRTATADMDDLVRDVASYRCAELDGKISDALRNTLFGEVGHDLATRNIFRGRDMGLASYADLARCYGTVLDPKVCKYANWNEVMGTGLHTYCMSNGV
jgi:hypothetical protein